MVVLTKEVTLNPGESQQVLFQVTPSEVGSYRVSVDGLEGAFLTTPPVGWILPTGHRDPYKAWGLWEGEYWDNGALAYDGLTRTSAWTWETNRYLEFTFPPILCDKIRTYDSEYLPGVMGVSRAEWFDADVTWEAHYNNAWHEIFSGRVPRHDWFVMPIGSAQVVDRVRIKVNSLHPADSLHPDGARVLLDEVELWQIS